MDRTTSQDVERLIQSIDEDELPKRHSPLTEDDYRQIRREWEEKYLPKPPHVTIGYDGRCDEEPTEEWERRPRWNPNDWKPLAVAWLIVIGLVAGLWLGGK